MSVSSGDELPGDEHKTNEDTSTLFKALRQLGPLFTSGIQLAAAVALMFFLGRWLDMKWETAPWMTIIGSVFGAGAGLYNFIKTANEVGKKTENDKTS